MNKQQYIDICEWQKATFGESTSLSKIAHLKEEIKELEEDIIQKSNNKYHEFADCFMLLFGAASAEGMTYEDIEKAIDEKMEINRKRKWGKPDKNGVVKHIEETIKTAVLTPRKQASTLIDKYIKTMPFSNIEIAKDRALIEVKSIDNSLRYNTPKDDPYANLMELDFWNDVKNELEKF